MSLPLPRLDDRTYEDLVEEARALIPALCPEWTDHNPSDPGIALVELFAWLTEQVLYRIDRIPERNYEVFLRILNGTPQGDGREVQSAPLVERIRSTVLSLQERYRAVTAEDYEHLVTGPQAKAEFERFGVIRRAHCVAERNLESRKRADRLKPRPGHMSVVVLPEPAPGKAPKLAPKFRKALWKWLDDRRLLTTRHHVVGPRYVEVAVTATLVPRANADPEAVQRKARKVLQDHFHPLEGGPEGTGWPFGRDVYFSDVYELLDKVPGVDYVEDDLKLAVTPKGQRPSRTIYRRTEGKRTRDKESRVGVRVHAHELVEISVDGVTVDDAAVRQPVGS